MIAEAEMKRRQRLEKEAEESDFDLMNHQISDGDESYCFQPQWYLVLSQRMNGAGSILLKKWPSAKTIFV